MAGRSHPVLSLAIGLGFAGLTFLAYETLHGGVVRGRLAWLRPIVGWIAFVPFTHSLRLSRRTSPVGRTDEALLPQMIRRALGKNWAKEDR